MLLVDFLYLHFMHTCMHASKNHVPDLSKFRCPTFHASCNLKCKTCFTCDKVSSDTFWQLAHPATPLFPAKISLLIRHPIVVTRANVTAVCKSLLIPLFEESENGGAGVA